MKTVKTLFFHLVSTHFYLKTRGRLNWFVYYS